MKADPTKYTAFRCPIDLLEFAKKEAKKSRRSLSNYIMTLIEAQMPKAAEPATK